MGVTDGTGEMSVMDRTEGLQIHCGRLFIVWVGSLNREITRDPENALHPTAPGQTSLRMAMRLDKGRTLTDRAICQAGRGSGFKR